MSSSGLFVGLRALARAGLVALVATGIGAGGAAAQDPFAGGWTLQPDASSLQFQSVKNNSVVESSTFATYTGEIAEDGTATVTIALDSVDTKIDLRNVRMRFLLFETFQFPEAVVTARIDPALVADLAQLRRKTVPLTFTLALHGVAQELTADVAVTLITGDLVSVASSGPVPVATALFNLDDGVTKLEEAAKVDIVPSASVTFDFVFARNAGAPQAVAAAAPAAPAPVRTALEPEGNFDLEACKGRFEILSRTDNINFASGSAALDPQSAFLLDSIADIVARCPGLRIVVAGHTDSDGPEATNRWLSQQRAASVVDYLVSHGVGEGRITSVGYGESRPLVPNDSPRNKQRNRRIEFAVADG
ncbi:OmpA family protein [Meridianimarinicoccus sp. RP-17]|uniref:OmpA family protein n=1 Tax=Meridianimarinicoccus zhengii TaxID=2056810 RepID=UPI001F47DADC|nr:OmpA family protein [Phycocomes zhengii]